MRFIAHFFKRVIIGFRIGWWAFKNPATFAESNFKMLSKLLELILKVSVDGRHRMTHIAYVHPEEGEKQIVSIWAGAGIGADPVKRISELLEENSRLKIELANKVYSEHRDMNNRNQSSMEDCQTPMLFSKCAYMVLQGIEKGNVFWTVGGSYRSDWYTLLFESDDINAVKEFWRSNAFGLGSPIE